MRETQVEIQDDVNSSPEHRVITITGSGSVITIRRTDTKDIAGALIRNPSKGVRANSSSSIVYFSTDGTNPTSNGITLSRGESASLPGLISNTNGIKVGANTGSVYVEIIMWG